MSYIKKQVNKKVVGLRVKTDMFINLPIKKKNICMKWYLYTLLKYTKSFIIQLVTPDIYNKGI